MGRYVGTGKDPEGRYSEGLIVDINDHDIATAGRNDSELSLVEKGWVKPLDPKDDPGRTEAQIANAVVRGDIDGTINTDATDNELAVESGFIDGYGEASGDAYDRVHEDPQPEVDDKYPQGAVSRREDAKDDAGAISESEAAKRRQELMSGGDKKSSGGGSKSSGGSSS